MDVNKMRRRTQHMADEIDHVRFPVINLFLQDEKWDGRGLQTVIRKPIQCGFVAHKGLKQCRHFIRCQKHMIIEWIAHDKPLLFHSMSQT